MMERIVYSLLVILSAAVIISAQGHPHYTVEATCDEKVLPGGTFEARVEIRPKLIDKLKDLPTYNWTVTAGTIESGQGTERIAVATDRAHAGMVVAAHVEAGGFYFQPLSASCSTGVEPLPEAIMAGETGIANVGAAERMMDELFEKLSAEPSARGIAAIYAPTTAARNRAVAFVKARIRGRAFDASRISISNSGKAKSATLQFWLVPAGADDPELKLGGTKRSAAIR